MALNGNFISFPSIIESVYRRVGYQEIDINEMVETIGETIRRIGVLPSFKDVTTNGLNGNPVPLEVVNFRAQLPSSYVEIKAARRVNLIDDVDDDGNTFQRIGSFSPMIASTDIFYQSTFDQNRVIEPSPSNYTYFSVAVEYTATLVGNSGTLTISDTGNLVRTVTFDTDLTTSASNFVTLYAADYALVGITVTSTDENIVFTEAEVGSGGFDKPTIANTSGDLNALVERNDTVSGPIVVESPSYTFREEFINTYKINNGYIYTNFENGYVELAYTTFVTDDHGFPMIPDDERYIEAIKWTLIEFIDYKKWRLGEIPDKVYYHTESKKMFWIRSAMSKAAIPSPDEMNAIKKMMLRSIVKTNEHDSYFKYSNIGEQRYTQNSQVYNTRFFRR